MRRTGIPFQLEDVPYHPEAVLLARQLHGGAAVHLHMQVEHGLPGLQAHGPPAVGAEVHPAPGDPHPVRTQIAQGQAPAQGLAVVDMDLQGRGRKGPAQQEQHHQADPQHLSHDMPPCAFPTSSSPQGPAPRAALPCRPDPLPPDRDAALPVPR